MIAISIKDLFDKFEFDPHVIIDEVVRIGDHTAIRDFFKKEPKNINSKSMKYIKTGEKFRKNFERGLLFYFLISHFKCKKLLEFGTGRGFVSAVASICPTISKVVTIDMEQTDKAIACMKKAGISMDKITFIRGNSRKMNSIL